MTHALRALLYVPLLTAFIAPAWALQGTEKEQLKQSALAFGQALVRADVAKLESLLPERGKVRMRLIRLGPGEGSYSANQAGAVLKDFLKSGDVASYDLVSFECGGERYALVHGRARIADRSGRAATIDLRLTFATEGGRWVLREIRETRP